MKQTLLTLIALFALTFNVHAQPAKCQTVQENGYTIRRITDGLIVYSRYTPVNADGTKLLVHGTDSHTARVIDLATCADIKQLYHSNGKAIGEIHEIRWSYNDPNIFFYVYGKAFYKQTLNGATTLVHDFNIDFPNMGKVMNDVEGDSSHDSRFWAFTIRDPYNGSKWPHRATISYDKDTDSILGVLDYSKYQSLGGKLSYLPTPNMVEMSPDGSKVIFHITRRWSGWGEADIGTVFDGPHAFDLNFSNPVKVSIASTHSGWMNGQFVSQQNRTDKIEARDMTGAITTLANHVDWDWTNFHFGKYFPDRVLVSTYDRENTHWAHNSLFTLGIDGTITELVKTHNTFDGNYRDEASAAVGTNGNVYWTSNWAGTRDVYELVLDTIPEPENCPACEVCPEPIACPEIPSCQDVTKSVRGFYSKSGRQDCYQAIDDGCKCFINDTKYGVIREVTKP